MDVHYFIFIINADQAIIGALIFGLAVFTVRLVYKMWRRSQRCPHCGEVYGGHQPVVPAAERTLPNSLWT